MLEELQIKDLAIIDDENVRFGWGLNVITGQTGAGKSIILQALALILGVKPKKNLIREGAKQSEVLALFSLEKLSLEERSALPEIVRDEDQLVVARTISVAGSSRVYINGKISTLGMLRNVVEPLIDLCGQSEFIRLYDPHYQMRLLDQFGARTDESYGALLNEYAVNYKKWREARMRLERSSLSLLQRQHRLQEVETLIRDVGNTRLGEGVRAELEERIKKLANGEQILSLSSEVVQAIEAEGGLLGRLHDVSGVIKRLGLVDSGFLALQERFFDIWGDLSGFFSDFERYFQGFSFDEEKLESARAELGRLAFLERKYATVEDDLKALYEQALLDREDLLKSAGQSGFQKELDECAEHLSRVASTLSAERRRMGELFAERVQNDLQELNMRHASLKVDFVPVSWGAYGAEEGEFLFSSNLGYAPKALRSIASGGELSRITLVMKNILSSQNGVSVMVFDEVDVGISGEVARSVGRKLKLLGTNSQVICITHLPQVASLADTHIYVEKSDGALTKTIVRNLSNEERVEELARMLAGYQVTESARESARDLMFCRDMGSKAEGG
jgi:DNA repair protein RecN (Recombination protein N)